MNNQNTSIDTEGVVILYESLLKAWNKQDASTFAAQFHDDANVVGFDGSQINGRRQIEKEMESIFHDHKVASYVWIVEEVRALAPNTFLLRASVGMVPPGKSETLPARNAIQSLVAVQQDTRMLITLFQNTPAAFDGRPALARMLTERLNEKVKLGTS